MKKILIAVDRTEGSLSVLSVLKNQIQNPQEHVLLHVQRTLGRSLMGGMLGETELSTLKESLKGTDYQEALDAESEEILSYYQNKLADYGMTGGKSVVTAGHPAGEILKVAREEKVDLIVLGSNPKSMLARLICGSTTREVKRKASIPVFIAKPRVAGGRERWETALDFWEAYALRKERLKMGF